MIYYINALTNFDYFKESLEMLYPNIKTELLYRDNALVDLGFSSFAPVTFCVDITKKELEPLIEEMYEKDNYYYWCDDTEEKAMKISDRYHALWYIFNNGYNNDGGYEISETRPQWLDNDL